MSHMETKDSKRNDTSEMAHKNGRYKEDINRYNQGKNIKQA